MFLLFIFYYLKLSFQCDNYPVKQLTAKGCWQVLGVRPNALAIIQYGCISNL